MSLLRFVEPTEGAIVVDGIDIAKIGLYDLRSRVVSSLPSQLDLPPNDIVDYYSTRQCSLLRNHKVMFYLTYDQTC